MNVYVVAIIIISIIFCVITFLKHKTLFMPNILFLLLWTVGAGIVNSNYAGILDINNETNVHIIIAIIAFNCASLLFCRNYRIKLSKKELCELLDISQLWNKILILNLSMVIFCFPYFLKMARIMLTQSFYEVRVQAYIYSNFYELVCSKIINMPMFALFNILLIITVLKMALGEKNNLKLYLLMIFDIVFFSIITGSRNYIAKPFIYFFIAYAFIHSISKEKLHIKPRIILICIITVVVLDKAIQARSLHGLSPIENIVVYLFGGIAYYDKIVFSGKFQAENAIKLYGQGVFGWIISPLLYLLSLLKITPDYVAESIIGRVSSQGVYISNTYNFNALTTSLYPMWRDFGVFGIVFGMMVFAIVVSLHRNRLFRCCNQKNLLIYFSFVCAVSECTQYYELLFIRFTVQILLILIIWRRKTNRKRMLNEVIKWNN